MLQSQLAASKEDKSELLRRLKKVKDVAKENQEKSGNLYVNAQIYPTTCSLPDSSLEDLGNSIKSIRGDADSLSGLTHEVRSMIPDIKDLRLKTNETIASRLLI